VHHCEWKCVFEVPHEKEAAMTRVTDLLGSRYPIIQGAMGVISNPEMVAAVSEAGGFGLLAAGPIIDKEILRSLILRTKELTKSPFGANLFMKNEKNVEFAKVLADEGIRVITVSGGAPKSLIPVLTDLGIKFIAVVSTVRAAVGVANLGAAAVVAGGSESGGIQGFHGCSTLVLVPRVVDAVEIPVIAAGGIADARSYRAAFVLGAEGVQIGTRFIASQECIAHRAYKDAILNADEAGAVLVDINGAQLRCLRTPLVERILSGALTSQNLFTLEAVKNSWLSGDLEAGLLASGQVSSSIKSIMPVKQIIENLVKN
jgi:enoyl-[acyl-carrier protein] reductase II